MNLLIVILIELGAVAGTGFLAYSMLSKAVGQAKQAIIQDVALKALESKTGISSNTVKSLVGEKPMASDPGTTIGGIANAVAYEIMRPECRVIHGVKSGYQQLHARES